MCNFNVYQFLGHHQHFIWNTKICNANSYCNNAMNVQCSDCIFNNCQILIHSNLPIILTLYFLVSFKLLKVENLASTSWACCWLVLLLYTFCAAQTDEQNFLGRTRWKDLELPRIVWWQLWSFIVYQLIQKFVGIQATLGVSNFLILQGDYEDEGV